MKTAISEWLTRPGFTTKLGANWVKVTETVFIGTPVGQEDWSEFETWPATPVLDSRFFLTYATALD